MTAPAERGAWRIIGRKMDNGFRWSKGYWSAPGRRRPAMEQQFSEIIVTRERLRKIYRQPSHLVANKVIDRIDRVCRAFIAACPFVVVATRGADGKLDLSPKGDPPGFILVLDDKSLAIPDRIGNNKLDTFENLLVHPEVGLFLL